MSEYINTAIVCSMVAFFLWGVGYMITQDANRTQLFKQQCVESGMQYLNGSCIK